MIKSYQWGFILISLFLLLLVSFIPVFAKTNFSITPKKCSRPVKVLSGDIPNANTNTPGAYLFNQTSGSYSLARQYLEGGCSLRFLLSTPIASQSYDCKIATVEQDAVYCRYGASEHENALGLNRQESTVTNPSLYIGPGLGDVFFLTNGEFTDKSNGSFRPSIFFNETEKAILSVFAIP